MYVIRIITYPRVVVVVHLSGCVCVVYFIYDDGVRSNGWLIDWLIGWLIDSDGRDADDNYDFEDGEDVNLSFSIERENKCDNSTTMY